MTYRHEVLAKAAKELMSEPVTSEDDAREFLDELVAEWEQATPAVTCEECGEPVVDGEPYAIEMSDGVVIAHAECLASTDNSGYDRRDDSGYWREGE